MALFQRNPFRSGEQQPLYAIGQEKTVLIVGLGNPGKKYDDTRHNVGFRSVDNFAKVNEFEKWLEKKDFKCQMTSKNIASCRVILIKPSTYMNESGNAIQAVAKFYKIPLDQIVVVHDELDISFGQIRTRKGGSAAGHNGLKSVIEHIGAEFWRIRIGIKSDTKMDATDFVLAKFSKSEVSHMKELTSEISSLLTEYIYQGELSPETRSFIV